MNTADRPRRSAERTITLRFGVLLVMLVLAAFSRLVPHPMNFAPIGAMALFGAAYFRSRWTAYLLPIVALWLSDIYINNVIYPAYYKGHGYFTEDMAWVYGTMLVTVLLSQWFLRKVNVVRVVLAAILASALFFAVTNLGCWVGSTDYSQDIAGSMTCYAAGIPFFKGTLFGNLFYSAVLFGGFELAQYRIYALRTAHG